MVLSILFISLLSFAKDVSSVPPCYVPQSSKWHHSLKQLVEETHDVFSAKLVSAEEVHEFPELEPDFSSDEDYAIDFSKRKKDGSRYTLDDKEVWNTTKWTFKVEDVLKGSFHHGDTFSLTSVNGDSKTEHSLTPLLCDYAIYFEKNKTYLIFKGSFHPKGYEEVSGPKDKWYQKVKTLVSKEKS